VMIRWTGLALRELCAHTVSGFGFSA